MAAMAPSPSSPNSCQNMMRTWRVAAKRILVSSWGQCASFRCRGEVERKKHKLSLQKLTFCPRARWADAQRIIVNKIKDFLVASIKITSPDRNDRDRSRDIRRSHSPLKMKPLGAGGLGEIMVSMFFFRLVFLCCVCVCWVASWEERKEKKKY